MIPSQDEAALEFQRWFGKSKMVDAEGKPLVAYHGTMLPEPIVEFSTRSALNDAGKVYVTGYGDPFAYLGPHFAIGEGARQIAEKFALGENNLVEESRDFIKRRADRLGKSAAPAVYPVYLKIENPRIFESETDLLSYINDCNLDDFLDLPFNTRLDVFALEFGLERDESIARVGPVIDLARGLGEHARHRLIEAGYDGVLYRNDDEGGLAVAPIKEPKEQIRFAIPNAHVVRKLQC
jgi:hypothetical protein